jgi:hypothetical protein
VLVHNLCLIVTFVPRDGPLMNKHPRRIDNSSKRSTVERLMNRKLRLIRKAGVCTLPPL